MTTTMTKEFTLPDLGEGVKEGRVLRLLVAEGEDVAEDQLLMEVETDKAAVEIPSPYAGTIARWHVTEQQVVNVGDVMVTFGGDGAATAAAPTPKRRASAVPAPPSPPSHGTATPASQAAAGRVAASPAVRKLARERGIDLSAISGSGPGGRVVRADIERAGAPSSPAATPTSPTSPTSPMPHSKRRRSAPPAGIPDGRDASDAYGAVVRTPMSQTRQAIAGVMSEAARTIPHVTDTDDADVTDLDRLRKGYNAAAAESARLGMLAFVVRAVVRGLQQHPIFNASLDEPAGEIVYKRYINIAIGVDTARGLVAPVIHDADRLTIPEINARLAELVARAQGGTFALDDTRGATYTISNAGAMGGSRYSTPIITPPQVAVLAIGRSRQQPWVVEDAVVPRLIMPLSHSMDHRLIDGAVEIAFMQQVIGDLENPARLML